MRVMELGDGVDYREAWALQRRLHDEVVAGGEDALLLLEHPSVYTAGTGTQPGDLPTDGSPVVEVDRGGRITWHGPGQLVAYPIVALHGMPVVDWVRRLEEAILATLRPLGLDVDRVRGRAGIWLGQGGDQGGDRRGDQRGDQRAADAGDDAGDAAGDRGQRRKIAQVGVRVTAGVSMHGIAINVAPDLAAFRAIVPCGIADADVTSIERELGAAPAVAEVGRAFAASLLDLGVAAAAPDARDRRGVAA